MKKPRHTIYVLSDPKTRKPFYIGQTSNTYLRYKDHCDPKPTDKSYRADYIRTMLKAGRKPNMLELEETDNLLDALMGEIVWIDRFKKSGMMLKNREAQKWLYRRFNELMTELRKN